MFDLLVLSKKILRQDSPKSTPQRDTTFIHRTEMFAVFLELSYERKRNEETNTVCPVDKDQV